MNDGLPSDTAEGWCPIGSWFALLLVVLFGGACGLGLYRFLSYAAEATPP